LEFLQKLEYIDLDGRTPHHPLAAGSFEKVIRRHDATMPTPSITHYDGEN
jgi:hypothetical protein